MTPPAPALACFIGASLLAAFTWSTAAVAQDVCFRGKPLPECSGSAITEAEISRFPEGAWGMSLSGGYVFNLSVEHAVGGLVFLEAGSIRHPNPRFGLRPRYRYWFGENISLDVSPGIILGSGNPDLPVGFSGDVGLNLFDSVAPFLRVEARPFANGPGPAGEGMAEPEAETGTDVLFSAGLRLGSYAGVAVGGSALLGAGIFYLVVCEGESGCTGGT